jgi:hypothetical protein
MDDERLPQKILIWIRTGRRKKGRPKTRWKEGVLRAMKECGLRDGDWEDRLRWRLGVERRCHTSYITLHYITSRIRSRSVNDWTTMFDLLGCCALSSGIYCLKFQKRLLPLLTGNSHLQEQIRFTTFRVVIIKVQINVNKLWNATDAASLQGYINLYAYTHERTYLLAYMHESRNLCRPLTVIRF